MRKIFLPILTATLLATGVQTLAADQKPGEPPSAADQKRGEPQRKNSQVGSSSAPGKPSQGQATQRKPEGQKQGRAQPSEKNQFGQWNSSWGKKPSAPPRYWKKKGDWYRHVRACQKRFKSYTAENDTYRTYSGTRVRCTL